MGDYRHYMHILLLAALMALAACNGDSTAPAEPEQGPAITLAAQVEGAATRGGQTGNIDYSVLALSSYGFGVFAHGTATAEGWTDWTNKPVTYNGPDNASNPGSVFAYPGSWTYDDGLKYWTKDVNGGDVDFFAYAPYVGKDGSEYTDATDGATGITAVNKESSDPTDPTGPTITYTIATEPKKCVDLLWGVNGQTGLPWTHTTYQKKGKNPENEDYHPTGGPVLMTFYHALAALGFHVQAMIDKTNDLDNLEDKSDVNGILGTDYKITIKQLTIDGSFYKTNTLDLKNTEPYKANWNTLSGDTKATLTLTVPNDQVNANFKYTTTEGIMNGSMSGVTQDAQQLLIAPHATTGAEQLFFVIPNSEQQNYTITIDWCVCHKRGSTYTAEDHTSTIPVKALALDAGTKYYFNLVFNLRTVSLSVTAEDWEGKPQDINVTIEHGTSASKSLAPVRR